VKPDYSMNTECLICDDMIDKNNFVDLPCHHYICINCFKKWYLEEKHNLKCVYCTKEFTIGNVKSIDKLNPKITVNGKELCYGIMAASPFICFASTVICFLPAWAIYVTCFA